MVSYIINIINVIKTFIKTKIVNTTPVTAYMVNLLPPWLHLMAYFSSRRVNASDIQYSRQTIYKVKPNTGYLNNLQILHMPNASVWKKEFDYFPLIFTGSHCIYYSGITKCQNPIHFRETNSV